jgi:hypothetical protein
LLHRVVQTVPAIHSSIFAMKAIIASGRTAT